VRFIRNGRRGEAAALVGLLRRRDVLTCGPVIGELLSSRSLAGNTILAVALRQLTWVELGEPDWTRAGEVRRLLAQRGTTTALLDVSMAVAAEKAGAELWTFDSDFQRVTEVMPALRLYQPPA
jgi:predicted nucleic acid-binding protein